MKRLILSLTIAIAFLSLAAFAQDPNTIREDDGPERQRVAAVAKSSTARFEFSEAEIHAFEKAAFALINKRRADIGLPELLWSEDAAKVARLHSANMAQLNFFSHRGADGKMVDERAEDLGVRRWRAIGENIAYMRGYTDPVATAVDKWMLSTGHRENLLNARWEESAIGIAVTADGTYYFTQVFLDKR